MPENPTLSFIISSVPHLVCRLGSVNAHFAARSCGMSASSWMRWIPPHYGIAAAITGFFRTDRHNRWKSLGFAWATR